MRFNVLIIEDDRTMIKSLKLTLEEKLEGVKVSSTGFKKAKERVALLLPDAVVMDIFEDQTKTTTKADATWDYIWDVHFCPVVVHSARDEPAFLKGKCHPFAFYEPKSKDSQERVAKKLESFRGHVDSLHAFADEVRTRASESLRHVSQLVWKETATELDKRDMLVRVTRRRLAASFDSTAAGGGVLRAFEQFIYPPLEPTLLTGDIVRRTTGDAKRAENYAIVLTPSCDLVVAAGRTAVDEALVARCRPVDDTEVLRRCVLQDAPRKDLPQKLAKRLRDDNRPDMIVLPALRGVWPAMVVDLKRLELVPCAKVALAERDACEANYIRLASMDSPFRERVAWRYITTCGRPGLPDWDRDALERDIVAAASQGGPS